jgi:P27 family predicted phage terminase small subunit
MAGRGPAPKDPVSRQRRNVPRALEVVAAAREVVATVTPIAFPDPPSGLLKKTTQRWEAFWTSPVAALVDRTSDMPALERLFELYDDCDRYRTAIRKNPMVTGSQGQMVRNPFVKDLKDAQAEVRQLEDRFGLSPRARLALNLTLGTTAKTLADLNADFSGGVDDDDPRADFIDGELVPSAERSA